MHRRVDMALCHLAAAVSEVKDNEWHPSPEVLSAFLKYYEEDRDVDGVEKFRKILSTSNFDNLLP